MAETITYNGIDLEVVKTNTIRRLPVYTDDGVDYKYTHWLIDVDCVFNPQATSVNANGQSQHRPGLLPAVTDVNIRQRLTAPRQLLIVRNGDANVILKTPADLRPKVFSDQANGPIPSEICSVQQIVGTKTFLVHFVVEAWVNECPNNPLILAHRWETEQDTDEDFYAVRVVKGEAVFNPAAMSNLINARGNGLNGAIPDQYRRDLFHPLPLGYQRVHLNVVVDSDGNSLRYVIVDREMPVDFPPPGFLPATVSRIECHQNAWFQQTGVLQAAFRVATNPSLANAFTGLVGGAFAGFNAIYNGANVQQAIDATGRGTLAGAILPYILPRYHYACTTRVWGGRGAQRGPNAPNQLQVNTLQSLAVGVTMSRLKVNPAWTTNEMSLAHDASGKFVEFSMTVSHGIEGGEMAGIQQSLGDLFSLNQQAFVRRFFADVVQDEFLRTGANDRANVGQINPGLPRGNGTRGTSLESLFAQALTDPCQTPAAPFNAQYPDKTFRS